MLIVAVGLALILGTVGLSHAGAKTFVVITTGGTGGLFYPLGGILAQALGEKYPDLVVTSQASNASVANCNLIREHQVETAFVQSNVAYAAYKGQQQFQDKAVANLRGIASLYPETIQIVARADSGVKTLADIKGKCWIPWATGGAGRKLTP